MADLAKRAVWTFAQAFLATFLVLAAGIAQAPNLADAKAALVSAIIAAIAAGLSAAKNALVTGPLR